MSVECEVCNAPLVPRETLVVTFQPYAVVNSVFGEKTEQSLMCKGCGELILNIIKKIQQQSH